MVMLDENQSFSLSANVVSPGPQTIVLRGYLVDRRSDGTYIAPFIPDLFYGADGNPLRGTWRQDLTQTGSQVVLSRSGGQPSVPREDLYWKKVEDNEYNKVQEEDNKPVPTQPVVPFNIIEWYGNLDPTIQVLIPIVVLSAVGFGVYHFTREVK